jgi:putative Mn2+ efflux pump MntP
MNSVGVPGMTGGVASLSWFTVVLIALGLAMDAFAVSVSCGLAFRRREHVGALRIALSFGLFQAAMPILGWLAGLGVRSIIEGFDHWVAFGLLVLVGGHMIREAVHGGSEEADFSPPGHLALVALSIATSIDALAVGLSLSLLKVAIRGPVVVIGVVTFAMSFLGVILGHEMKGLLRGRGRRTIQVLGGIVLIAIGVRILLRHTTG